MIFLLKSWSLFPIDLCGSWWLIVTLSLPWWSCILLSLVVLGPAAPASLACLPQKHRALVHPWARLLGGRRISPRVLLHAAPGSPEGSEGTGGVPVFIPNHIQECYAEKPSDSQPGFSWNGSGSVSYFSCAAALLVQRTNSELLRRVCSDSVSLHRINSLYSMCLFSFSWYGMRRKLWCAVRTDCI